MSKRILIVLTVGIMLTLDHLQAASYIVAADADLIHAADAIAIVTIQSSQSYFNHRGQISTDHVAEIERPIKGSFQNQTIVIEELGGTVGDLAMVVSSAPNFVPGERTLLMMTRRGEARFSTYSGALGKFSFVTDTRSRQLLVRGASEGEIFGWDLAGRRHIETPRRADAFLRYIDRVLAGEDAATDYVVRDSPLHPIPDSHVPMGGNDYLLQFSIGSNTRGGKWPGGLLDMKSVGTQTGVANLTNSINTAAGVWSGAPNSSIGLTYSGATTGANAADDYGNADGKFLMFFDQPNSGPLAGNVVGQANIWASSSVIEGQYFTALDCDIIIEVGFTGALFEEILSHEKGHCLGFRHSNEPTGGQVTTATAALMRSNLGRGGANLGDWDRDAASHVYGGNTCTAPSITTQPQSRTIQSGDTTLLSVSASGTSPLSYQWYTGARGVTTNPVPGGTSSTINVSPPTTTSYWVRVTGQCGTPADSVAVTVTVTPPCVAPSITNQPQSVNSSAGKPVSLNVAASGTAALTYQWFIGARGNTANPIVGATSSILNVAPTSTTTYWVRVTGQCGSPVDSNAATITIASGKRRATRH
jgi:hypothetical protein